MSKSKTQKIRELIPTFVLVMCLVGVIVLWNILGWALGLVYITGLAATVLKAFLTFVAIHLGFFDAVNKVAMWFAEGFVSTLEKEPCQAA